MRVTVNGQARDLAEHATVADVVAAFGPQRAGDRVAVAVNGAVVRRGAWGTTAVADGDHVELLAAMQGGANPPTPTARRAR